MKRVLLCLLVLSAVQPAAVQAADAPDASGPDAPGPDPTVQVRTEPSRRGDMPLIVTAYGTVAYGAGSVMVLSLQQECRVTHVWVTPGEAVSEGQTLVAFSPSAQAASSFRQAQTALALAQQQRLHTAQLLSQHLATRDLLAQAEKAVLDAQSTLQALPHEGGMPDQTVKAPFDGVVQGVPVSPGALVQSGMPLAIMARNDGLMVTAGIEPELRSQVHPGEAVALTSLRGGSPVMGQVLRLRGQINPSTRLVDVDISMPAGAMVAGESVRADLTTGVSQGWLVPRAAITQVDGGLSIYQVARDHAVRVPVVLDAERDEQDLVSGRLDASRPVVAEGAYQLSDGARVRLQP